MHDDHEQPRSVFVDVLRWIAALPLAALAAYLAYLVMGWAVRYGLAYADIRSDSIFVQIYDVTLVHGCMGAAFVYVGTSVAPRFQDAASFVLAGLAIAAAGFLAFPAYLIGNWWALVGAVFVAIGAGVIVWMFKTGEVEPF